MPLNQIGFRKADTEIVLVQAAALSRETSMPASPPGRFCALGWKDRQTGVPGHHLAREERRAPQSGAVLERFVPDDRTVRGSYGERRAVEVIAVDSRRAADGN